MSSSESMTDYQAYWKAGSQEPEQHEQRKEQYQDGKTRYDAIQGSQRMAKGQAAGKDAIRSETV